MQPTGAKPVCRLIPLAPWGMYAAGKKEEKSAAKPERGRLQGTLGGRYKQARLKEVKQNRPRAAEPARGRQHGTWGALNRKPVFDNVGPNYATWDLCKLSMGRQWSVTWNLMRDVGHMGVISGAAMVDNAEPRHVSNSLKAFLARAAQRRSSSGNKYANMLVRRQL